MPSTNLKRANAASRKFDRPKTTAIKCSAGRCGVRGIVFQNPICLHRQRVAVMRARIHIDSDHVRPFFEILLTCWRELTLIILRPALEITDTTEHECGSRFCSGSRVGCNSCGTGGVRLPTFCYGDAVHPKTRHNKRGKTLQRTNFHAVVTGGTGGGIPADIRFRQAKRCRMRKISQVTNASRPPGIVTSMNQPITPSE